PAPGSAPSPPSLSCTRLQEVHLSAQVRIENGLIERAFQRHLPWSSRRDRRRTKKLPLNNSSQGGIRIMINRRQLVCTAAAALFAQIPKAFAATYDLIIRGGRVIDPSIGLDAVRDVAISGSRIAAVEAGIASEATETIDARGKIVTPGLIDIHTHAGRSADGPPMCLQDGVTGWVDAGTGGADNMDTVAAIARGAPQIGRCLVNIARTGVIAPGGEL